MTGSLIILGCFLFGLILQSLALLPDWISDSSLDNWVLYALMLLVGILVCADRQSMEAIRRSGIRTLAIPVLTVMGTAAGVLLGGALLSFDLRHALAVGFGLGYYSLSSILIGEWVGGELAVVALLSNIMRELLTLLAAPLLFRLFGPLGPVVSGGATAMDTTLPIIIRCSGQEYGPIAVFSGIVLTVLVPVLVSVALRL